MDRAIRAGHFTDEFSGSAEVARRGPAVGRAAEIFDEGDVAGAIARDEVLVAVAVPIDRVGRGERTEFHVGRKLAEIARRQKLRHPADGFPRVFDERHAAVFITDDQVEITVAVEVHRGGRDHAEVHFHGEAGAREFAAGSVNGLGARARIFVIGETVAELAADEVEVAVAIEVAPARRRHAEGIDIFAAGLQAHGRGVNGFLRRARVADNVDVAAEFSARPLTLRVERALAAVERAEVAPEVDADGHVERAIAVEVDELPLILPDVAGLGEDFFRHGELSGFRELRLQEIRKRIAAVVVDLGACGFGGRRRGDDGFTRDIGNADGRRGFSDEHGRLEDRELELRIHLPAVLEIPGAVVGFVSADDDEVHQAVAVVIHGQRPRPEADAEVGESARVVVGEARKNFGFGGGANEVDAGAEDKQGKERGGLHEDWLSG